MVERTNTTPTDGSALRLPKLGDWLWRRWYAKLWWIVIAIWWAGMAASIKLPLLSTFYASALAGYLNLLFYPVTALIVLGFGYARARLAAFAEQAAEMNEPAFDPTEPYPHTGGFPHREFGRPHPSLDIYDPRSGTLYVGNALSQNNGARINVS